MTVVEIKADEYICSHYSKMWDNLVEQNLYKVVEPYSRVQISHVADVIGLSQQEVQQK